jgi:NADPH-dependent 2,4-dienoyl-CoA reductase/sulfur reductase-like enzyme
MPRTSEGYRHDSKNGLSGGFETDAVVEPAQVLQGKTRWDCVVIGAGYAGLIAARDLVISGAFLPL